MSASAALKHANPMFGFSHRPTGTSSSSLKKGNFGSLYYRLNVIQLEIPPLRKRLEDIPILCEHLVQKFQRYNPKGVIGVTTDAIQKLQKYNWPGNVRQLENVLERAYHFCSENWITDYHIQLETTTPQPNQNTLNPSYPTKTLSRKRNKLKILKKKFYLKLSHKQKEIRQKLHNYLASADRTSIKS